jgi:hypothetical protein
MEGATERGDDLPELPKEHSDGRGEAVTDEVNLHATIDAEVWAAEFCRLFPDADYGLMLGWFANAIMTGYDEAMRRVEREEIVAP